MTVGSSAPHQRSPHDAPASEFGAAKRPSSAEEQLRVRRLQWRMLLTTMFCYLFYYTGRQSFGFAIPGIQEELGLSKTELGAVSTALL